MPYYNAKYGFGCSRETTFFRLHDLYFVSISSKFQTPLHFGYKTVVWPIFCTMSPTNKQMFITVVCARYGALLNGGLLILELLHVRVWIISTWASKKVVLSGDDNLNDFNPGLGANLSNHSNRTNEEINLLYEKSIPTQYSLIIWSHHVSSYTYILLIYFCLQPKKKANFVFICLRITSLCIQYFQLLLQFINHNIQYLLHCLHKHWYHVNFIFILLHEEQELIRVLLKYWRSTWCILQAKQRQLFAYT